MSGRNSQLRMGETNHSDVEVIKGIIKYHETISKNQILKKYSAGRERFSKLWDLCLKKEWIKLENTYYKRLLTKRTVPPVDEAAVQKKFNIRTSRWVPEHISNKYCHWHNGQQASRRCKC